MEKEQTIMAILKLYELRRNEKMRQARSWFFQNLHRNQRWILSIFIVAANRQVLISEW